MLINLPLVSKLVQRTLPTMQTTHRHTLLQQSTLLPPRTNLKSILTHIIITFTYSTLLMLLQKLKSILRKLFTYIPWFRHTRSLLYFCPTQFNHTWIRDAPLVHFCLQLLSNIRNLDLEFLYTLKCIQNRLLLHCHRNIESQLVQQGNFLNKLRLWLTRIKYLEKILVLSFFRNTLDVLQIVSDSF